MSFPPAPRQFYCPQCGWQKSVYPHSDAMRMGFDWFERCPRCHHQPLEQRPLPRLERLLHALFKR